MSALRTDTCYLFTQAGQPMPPGIKELPRPSGPPDLPRLLAIGRENGIEFLLPQH